MEEGTSLHSFPSNSERHAQRLPSRGSFDLRRPIMSNSNSNSNSQSSYSFSDYIDLTGSDDLADQNVPSQAANPYVIDQTEVIDLEDSTSFSGGRVSSGQTQHTNARTIMSHSSDEVQFLYQRQLAGSGRSSSRPQTISTHDRIPPNIPPGSILPVPWGSVNAYPDTHNHQSSSGPDVNATNLWGTTGSFTSIPAHFYRQLARRMPQLSSMSTRPPQHGLDYSQVAFSMLGYPNFEEQRTRSRGSSVPAVEDLPPAPAGFTRTPEEGMSLICPNCERELTVGQTDSQRHIFVAKSCGHVYCGECALNRAQTKRKREKMPSTEFKTKPFSTCVAPGCKTSLRSPNAMVQIFL